MCICVREYILLLLLGFLHAASPLLPSVALHLCWNVSTHRDGKVLLRNIFEGQLSYFPFSLMLEQERKNKQRSRETKETYLKFIKTQKRGVDSWGAYLDLFCCHA